MMASFDFARLRLATPSLRTERLLKSCPVRPERSEAQPSEVEGRHINGSKSSSKPSRAASAGDARRITMKTILKTGVDKRRIVQVGVSQTDTR